MNRSIWDPWIKIKSEKIDLRKTSAAHSEASSPSLLQLSDRHHRKLSVRHLQSRASESTFSTGGRVVSKHRSRLHPDTIETLMCVQDWLCTEMDDKIAYKFPKYEAEDMDEENGEYGDVVALSDQ